MPKRPATIIFKTIEIDIIKESVVSLNHTWTIAALIIANIIPFNIPIENSLAGRVADIHRLIPKYKLQIHSEHFQNGVTN